MTPIDTLALAGLLCRLEGDRLMVSPTAKLTPALRDLIRENRAAIVEELSRPLPPAPPRHLVEWGKTATGQQWVEAELSQALGYPVVLLDPLPVGAGLPGTECPADAGKPIAEESALQLPLRNGWLPALTFSAANPVS